MSFSEHWLLACPSLPPPYRLPWPSHVSCLGLAWPLFPAGRSGVGRGWVGFVKPRLACIRSWQYCVCVRSTPYRLLCTSRSRPDYVVAYFNTTDLGRNPGGGGR